MDCCNFGGGAGAWDGYARYAPLQYAPYAHGYYAAHTHDPYMRYPAYRYDYASQHVPHVDHGMPMDYGGYSSKEVRARRALARRDSRSRTPVQHLPIPPTSPLECGLTGRGSSYYEPQMWHHYQMGVMNGGGGGGGVGGGGGGWGGGGLLNGSAWPSRPLPCRDQMRYPSEYRSIKGPHYPPNQMYPPDGRSTPYSMYEDSPYTPEACVRRSHTAEPRPAAGPSPAPAERPRARPAPTPPPEKPPPVLVPLPAFQQAFGSTEIGKFAEAFSRTELALEEVSGDTFSYESFPEWEAPEWAAQAPAREIKCEDSF